MALYELDAQQSRAALADLLQSSALPAFCSSSARALELLDDDGSESEDIAKVLELDAGLTVRVLAIANSAACGARAVIEDLPHALRFLGRPAIRNVVMAAAVRDALGRVKGAQTRGFDERVFWSGAARRATFARDLTARTDPKRAAAAFTSGFLQDVAVPLIVSAYPENYGPILLAWEEDPRTSLDAIEREVFGWCHAHAGGLLIQAWGLPESLAVAVGQHHSEFASDIEVTPELRVAAQRTYARCVSNDALILDAAATMLGLESEATLELVEEADRAAASLLDSI